MKAQDLKNSILQLAMEGKLVPQNLEDEPASVLLEKIRAEKEKLIKAKKIKRNKKESIIYRENSSYYEKRGTQIKCIDDEIPFEIPTNWEWARFSNFLSVFGGKRVPKGYELLDNPTNHIYIRVKDMKHGTIVSNDLRYIDDEIYEKIKKYVIHKNDLYLTIAGTIGKVGSVPDQFDGMNLTENAVKLTNILINKEFLKILIDSNFVQLQFIKKTNKVAQPKLAIKRILATLLPIPPIKEQKRIVKKIEELLPYIKKYGEAEEKLENLNETFPEKIKASILQEAVQGKLVPQDTDDEPADILFKKIVEEKRRVIKKNKKQKLDSEPLSSNDLPFDLPKGWIVCKLDQISENIHYGYSTSADFGNKNIKLLRISDIQNNRVNWNTVPGCNVEKDKISNYMLNKNDILIARTGGTIGKTFIVKNLSVKSIFASYLIRVIPLKLINADYLKLFLESPFYWNQLQDKSKGTGQPNVNATNLKKLIITLPPLEEQKRIVNKIEQLFEMCENLII